jgi:outer membrane lipopolysaccharide assembly protein LptE/RlpB
MKKKLFTYLLLVFLSSCGYEALYSKKNQINYDFSISELNFNGDREINLKIKEKLNNYTLNKKIKKFRLKISSTSKKTIITKNEAGDATKYKIEVIVDIEVLKNDSIKSNFIITESFDYSNNSDKFELKSYEREIKNSLSNTTSNKLILRLSNI